MTVINSPLEMQKTCTSLRTTKSVGFVPTMGALHSGHFELIKKSKSENDVTIVSIFVNPTQFNNPEDFKKYPNTLGEDIRQLESLGVDYLFQPSYESMYVDQFNYAVTEKKMNALLCGASRPGHFSGVLTVVLKLFFIINPTRAYFGKKDFQQYEIIRGMVEAFFIPTELIPVETVRDESGLALSSRNQRLSSLGIKKARLFAQMLHSSMTISELKTNLEKNDIDVDYVEDLWGRRFAAVFIDNVRLIDNVPL